MSIVKVQKRDNPYVQIDNRPLNDKRLSWKARGLLAYLLSKPADWEVIITALVKESPGGEETVRGALKELEENGYAKLDTLRCEKGRVSGKRWIILELSTDMAVSPTSGFTSSGKTGTTNKREIQMTDLDKEAGKPEDLFAVEKIAPPDAEMIYKAYPKHVAKPAALRAIQAAMKRGNRPEILLEKTGEYADRIHGEKRDLAFVPHPATWFNQDRFNDDPSTWTNGEARNGVAKPKAAANYENHGFV